MKRLSEFLRKTCLWLILLPCVCTGLGVSLNQLVLIANHDRFPVMLNSRRVQGAKPDSDGMIDDIHCVMDGKSRLSFMADWIDLQDATYSPGDVLLEAADYMWTYCPVLWICLVLSRLTADKEEHADQQALY